MLLMDTDPGETQKGIPQSLDKEHQLVLERAKIIDDIVSQGLLSAKTLHEQGRKYYGSFDDKPINLLSGYEISNRYQSVEKDINMVLYMRSVVGGILEVILERPDERLFSGDVGNRLKNWSKRLTHGKIYEERLQSSFLVIAKGMGGHGLKGSLDVPVDDIKYLVIPVGIWQEYQRTSENAANLNIPVKVVKDYINRTVAEIPFLTIPNYEDALKEIFDEIGYLWVHGVRLPTVEDLK